MASYSYAGLEVRVTADTRGMSVAIRDAATGAGEDAASRISQTMTAGLKAAGNLLASVGKAATTALGLASGAAIGFGVASFQSAARVGEMDATLRALAKANGLNYDAMQQSVKAIRGQGIEYGVAQQTVAQFARSQLDLSKSTDLARVAQDAAVISGKNSTETLADLIHGITTQNSMVLKNAGLQVQAGKAVDQYAKSVGKAAKDLTDAERAQAVLNAVLEDGKNIAGAYEEAMREPGKVLRSFPRIIDDIKVSVGAGLVKALGPAILQTYDLAKAFSKAIEPGGVLAPVFDAIGVAVGKLAAPVTAMIERWTTFIANLKPEQVAAIVATIEKFGPALLIAAGAMAAFTGAGIITKIPIIGGLLSNLLGPVKALGGGLLSVGKAALGLGPGMSAGAAGAGGLGKALSALLGPVGLVIAAVALVVASSSKLRGSLLEFGKAIISALLPAFKAIFEGVKQLIPPIMEVARAVGDALAPVFARLAPLLEPLGKLLGQQLAQGFANLATVIRAVLPGVLALIQVIGFLLDRFLAVVVPIATFAIKLLTVASAASAVTAPLKAFAAVLSVVSNAIATVVRWILGGSPGLIPALQALAGVIGAVSGVISGIVGVFRAMAAGIAAAWSAVTSSTAAAWSAITGAVRAGGAAVTAATSAAFNAVRSVVTAAMSAVTSAVASGMGAARSAAASGASAIASAISSAMSAVRSAVTSAFSGIAGIVSSGLSSAIGAATSGGAAIVNGLRSGIESAASGVMSAISSVASRVSGALSSALKIGSPSRLTIPMGRAVIEGLEVGMRREARHVEITDLGLVAPGLAGSPLLGGLGGLAGLGQAGAGATINVYPSAGMDERALAAMVSRELAWATAGGA